VSERAAAANITAVDCRSRFPARGSAYFCDSRKKEGGRERLAEVRRKARTRSARHGGNATRCAGAIDSADDPEAMRLRLPCRTPPHHRADRRYLRADGFARPPAARYSLLVGGDPAGVDSLPAGYKLRGGEGDVPGLGLGRERGWPSLIDISDPEAARWDGAVPQECCTRNTGEIRAGRTK